MSKLEVFIDAPRKQARGLAHGSRVDTIFGCIARDKLMQSISRNGRIEGQSPRGSVEGEKEECCVGIGTGEEVMELHSGMIVQRSNQQEFSISCHIRMERKLIETNRVFYV